MALQGMQLTEPSSIKVICACAEDFDVHNLPFHKMDGTESHRGKRSYAEILENISPWPSVNPQ